MSKIRVRASIVCVAHESLLCVRLRDPKSLVARLFVPGGALEADETPAEAAERETFEETGHRVVVDEASELVARYPFVWNGAQFDCTTHFFRVALASDPSQPAPVSDAAYNEGALWLPLSNVDAELSFCHPILDAVRRLL